jgi:hypothetical protein
VLGAIERDPFTAALCESLFEEREAGFRFWWSHPLFSRRACEHGQARALQ